MISALTDQISQCQTSYQDEFAFRIFIQHTQEYPSVINDSEGQSDLLKRLVWRWERYSAETVMVQIQLV